MKRDERWFAKYYILKNHIKTKKTYPNSRSPVGAWLCRQKVLYRQGKLIRYQMLHLEWLPNWSWTAESTHIFCKWKKMYQQVEEYIKLHNRLPTPKEKNMYAWVDFQKTLHRANTLPELRKRLLAKLPYWKWATADTWNKRFQELKHHLEQKKSYPKSRLSSIGVWFSLQKHYYRKEKLALDRIKLLESLPDWSWDNPLKKNKASLSMKTQ